MGGQWGDELEGRGVLLTGALPFTRCRCWATRLRRFRGIRAHLGPPPASRFVFDARGPCSVVKLAFARLEVGADPGDVARARSPVTGGQCAGDWAGGVWLLTGLLSVIVGVRRRVYAIFAALTALVVLVDLGDVAVASC